ncbi:hypothetical protein SLITO_v1c02150 [Spiroplasma litorale]|uniref:Lipoyl-binding domain-containing protein n=1 Tax=Spiroplasma litorale TaxID=216942 RepID=A0A0K1W111_9MOLU|nr:biotin/lipoyl-binding protein [Spiroplasma litorale]AKX33876.1 hypothetical protein SLITO_v1c02150 [Spiroplasma litorale]
MERIFFNNNKNLKGIVDEVFVKEGQPVKVGDVLTTISTQLEKVNVISPIDGVIKNVYIIDSLIVSCNDTLFEVVTHNELLELTKEPNNINDTLREGLDEFNYFDNFDNVESDPIVDSLEKKLDQETQIAPNNLNDKIIFNNHTLPRTEINVSKKEHDLLNKNLVQINDSITQELSFFTNNTSLEMENNVFKEETKTFIPKFNQENIIKEEIKKDLEKEKEKFNDLLDSKRLSNSINEKNNYFEKKDIIDTKVEKDLSTLNDFNQDKKTNSEINGSLYKEKEINIKKDNLQSEKVEFLNTNSSINLSLNINQLLNLQDILYKPSFEKNIEIKTSTLLIKALAMSLDSLNFYENKDEKNITIIKKTNTDFFKKTFSHINYNLNIFDIQNIFNNSNLSYKKTDFVIYDFIEYRNVISSFNIYDESIFSISLNNINQLINNDGTMYNNLNLNISYNNKFVSIDKTLKFIDVLTNLIENPGYLI